MMRVLSSSALFYSSLASECDVEQMSALQTKTQMAERASAGAGGNVGLDRGLAGKGGETKPHMPPCDQAAEEELVKCFQIGKLNFTTILDAEFNPNATTNITDLLGELENLKNKQGCEELRADFKCMQGNGCWYKTLKHMPGAVKDMCKKDTDYEVMDGITVGDLCKKKPIELCQQLGKWEDVKGLMTHCEASCAINIEQYFLGNQSSCEGGEKIETEDGCKRAAQMERAAFKVLKKSHEKKRPCSCYAKVSGSKYKVTAPAAGKWKKRKLYWNPCTDESANKTQQAKTSYKNRHLICKGEGH